MAYFSRPAMIVQAEQFRVTEPQRIPGVTAVMYDSEGGAVRGEYFAERPIPSGCNLGFAVWTPGGWRLVTDGDWLVQTGRELQVWSHERFIRRFTAMGAAEAR